MAKMTQGMEDRSQTLAGEHRHKSLLCVGGPCAGERRAILYGNGFCVAVREELPDPTAADYMPNATVQVERIHYRAELFNTPTGQVHFWVPKDQTPLETMELLLATYERATSPRSQSAVSHPQTLQDEE